jgi:hypothetical protein
MSARAARIPSLQPYIGASWQVPGHQKKRPSLAVWYPTVKLPRNSTIDCGPNQNFVIGRSGLSP